MTALPVWRLNLLRCAYALATVGGLFVFWAQVIDPARSWELMQGVVVCMLAAMSALAALGLLYPRRMLPLLLWETLWKLIWLLRVALPHWRANDLDPDTIQVAAQCSLVVLVLAAVPWRFVWSCYVRGAPEPWRAARR